MSEEILKSKNPSLLDNSGRLWFRFSVKLQVKIRPIPGLLLTSSQKDPGGTTIKTKQLQAPAMLQMLGMSA